MDDVPGSRGYGLIRAGEHSRSERNRFLQPRFPDKVVAQAKFRRVRLPFGESFERRYFMHQEGIGQEADGIKHRLVTHAGT